MNQINANQKDLVARLNEEERKIAERRERKSGIRSRLGAAALAAGVLFGAGAYEALNPRDAEACMSVYKPGNSFYDKYIRNISSDPEEIKEDMKNVGRTVYIRYSGLNQGIIHLLNMLKHPQQFTTDAIRAHFPTHKGKIRLYTDLSDAQRNLGDEEYVLEFKVQTIEMPTVGAYALEPVVTRIYNNKGQALELNVKKPDITIFTGGHYTEWQKKCRTNYSISESELNKNPVFIK